MNGWILAGALWLACALGVWAWWVAERRAQTARWVEADAGSRGRHPSAPKVLSWLCPYCPDVVTGQSVSEVDRGAKEHMRLCAFYRYSGGEATQ